MKKQNSFLVAALLIIGLSSSAFARQIIQVASISGASTFSSGNSLNAPTIIGGTAGSVDAGQCMQKDGINTCNNCVYTPFAGSEFACNTKRIYPSLMLTITFQVTKKVNPIGGVAPRAWLVYTPIGGTTQPIPNAIYSGRGLTHGSTDTISIAWSDLCVALTGDANCETNTGVTAYAPQYIYIAIDSNNPPTFASGSTQLIQLGILKPQSDYSVNSNNILSGCFSSPSQSLAPAYGFCNFNVRAGNQKVYIENPSPIGTCNQNYNGVRVFYQPDNGKNTFMNATYGAPYVDFKLDSNCNPKGIWSIAGLQQKMGYFFRISMLDVANNNAFLLSATDSAGTGIMDQQGGSVCPNKTEYSFSDAVNCGQYGLITPPLR